MGQSSPINQSQQRKKNSKYRNMKRTFSHNKREKKRMAPTYNVTHCFPRSQHNSSFFFSAHVVRRRMVAQRFPVRVRDCVVIRSIIPLVCSGGKQGSRAPRKDFEEGRRKALEGEANNGHLCPPVIFQGVLNLRGGMLHRYLLILLSCLRLRDAHLSSR